MENNKKLVIKEKDYVVYTKLTNSSDELIVVREMLNSETIIQTDKGTFRKTDFTGKQRDILLKRYFDLVYEIDTTHEIHPVQKKSYNTSKNNE